MSLITSISHLLGDRSDDTSVSFAEISKTGHRSSNQDYAGHLFTKHGLLLILADGLGGHSAGDLASSMFCESFLEVAKKYNAIIDHSPAENLDIIASRAAEEMSRQVHYYRPGANAHTTCAICWISHENILTTLHVGDSRIYRFNKDEVLWHSKDHSLVQMLVDNGEIEESEMGTHPKQGSLTRSIAVNQEIDPTTETHSAVLSSGEAILLCSDGFWEMITPDEICTLATQGNPQKALEKLVNTAIKRAAPESDNVTAQLLLI